MKLRLALSALSVAAVLVGAMPATAADSAADVTLAVTSDGAVQTWSATRVPVGAGPELVGAGSGTCGNGGLVDIDPSNRTITVVVARAEGTSDVSLVVASSAIGGIVPITPELSDAASALTLTVTPEIAMITWHAAPTVEDGCATATAVFGFTAPGEPLSQDGGPVVSVLPAGSDATGAGAAPVVVADPTFAG